jgi:hypothetical protein
MPASSGRARIALRRIHIRLALALFLPTFASAFRAPPGASAYPDAAPSVTVRGRVIDRESGQPVANAQVLFAEARKRAYTDRDGAFEVGGLPQGEHHFSVTQLGYLRVQQLLVVPARGTSFTVRLTRDPVMLQRISVQADRLEARRQRTALASRVFDEKEIGMYRRSSGVQLVSDRAGLRLLGCGDPGEAQAGCAWIRGAPDRVAVVVDEQLQRQGMDDLGLVPLNEIYRMEVYSGGEMIVVYTKQFMRTMLAHNRPLYPLSAYLQMQHGVGLQHGNGVGLQP